MTGISKTAITYSPRRCLQLKPVCRQVRDEWTSLIGQRATPGRPFVRLSAQSSVSHRSLLASSESTDWPVKCCSVSRDNTMTTDFHASLSINRSSSSSSSHASQTASALSSRLDTGVIHPLIHPFSIDAIIGDVTSSTRVDHFRAGYLNTGT